jgi:hypothetical protein
MGKLDLLYIIIGILCILLLLKGTVEYYGTLQSIGQDRNVWKKKQTPTFYDEDTASYDTNHYNRIKQRRPRAITLNSHI